MRVKSRLAHSGVYTELELVNVDFPIPEPSAGPFLFETAEQSGHMVHVTSSYRPDVVCPLRERLIAQSHVCHRWLCDGSIDLADRYFTGAGYPKDVMSLAVVTACEQRLEFVYMGRFVHIHARSPLVNLEK